MSLIAVINCSVLRPQAWLREGLVLVQKGIVRAIAPAEEVPLPSTTRLLDARGGVIAGLGAEACLQPFVGRSPGPRAGTKPDLPLDSPFVLWPGSPATFACYHYGQPVWAMIDGEASAASSRETSPPPTPYQSFLLRFVRFLHRQAAHRRLQVMNGDAGAARRGITLWWGVDDGQGEQRAISMWAELPSRHEKGVFFWSQRMEHSAAQWCFYALPAPTSVLMIPLKSTRAWLHTHKILRGSTSASPVPFHDAQAAVPKIRVVSLKDV